MSATPYRVTADLREYDQERPDLSAEAHDLLITHLFQLLANPMQRQSSVDTTLAVQPKC